ncbi:hypothetical protein F4677DRAFT_424580 [Hypoxylon crocopeplum]|nr:hypothetical protein F4677DRAFT_424580 [Hypoxylon crocopeplum]
MVFLTAFYGWLDMARVQCACLCHSRMIGKNATSATYSQSSATISSIRRWSRLPESSTLDSLDPIGLVTVMRPQRKFAQYLLTHYRRVIWSEYPFISGRNPALRGCRCKSRLV